MFAASCWRCAAKISRLPSDDCSVGPTHSPPLAARSVMWPIHTPETCWTDGDAGLLSPQAGTTRLHAAINAHPAHHVAARIVRSRSLPACGHQFLEEGDGA